MKVSRAEFLIGIMSILMIRPYYVQLNNRINTVWAYATVLMAILSMVILIMVRKVQYTREVYLFFLIYLVATGVNKEGKIVSAISVIGQASLAYNIGVLYLVRPFRKAIEKIFPIVLTMYLYLDAVSVIFHISERFFHIERIYTLLGYDNYAIFYVLPMLVVKMALSTFKKGRLTQESIICWGICTLSKIITGAYTATIILIIFLFSFLAIMKIKEVKNFITVKNVLIFMVLMFGGIYCFEVQNIFASLLNATGKGITLNSRTVIWDHVMPRLIEVPLFGLGKIEPETFRVFFGFPYGYTATHAHNFFLELVIQTGFLGLFLYLVLISRIKKVVKTSKAWYRVLYVGIVSYLLLAFWDSYPFISGTYLLISFAKHMPVVHGNEECI